MKFLVRFIKQETYPDEEKIQSLYVNIGYRFLHWMQMKVNKWPLLIISLYSALHTLVQVRWVHSSQLASSHCSPSCRLLTFLWHVAHGKSAFLLGRMVTTDFGSLLTRIHASCSTHDISLISSVSPRHTRLFSHVSSCISLLLSQEMV